MIYLIITLAIVSITLIAVVIHYEVDKRRFRKFLERQPKVGLDKHPVDVLKDILREDAKRNGTPFNEDDPFFDEARKLCDEEMSVKNYKQNGFDMKETQSLPKEAQP